MKIKTKAVLFARVSTREQAEEGYSLPAQEKLLKEYADKNCFLLVKRFSIPESAKGQQERKLFNELLFYIDKHPKVKVVVCEKVDRITRNFKDAIKLDDWLNSDEERQLHFVKQGLIVHKNASSHERFQWDIYIALARQYSNNLSEETKKGLYEKAEQGWYPGNHKRGYRAAGETGQKIWIIDEEKSEAKFITKAFELYATGRYTLKKISLELYKQGWVSKLGKPISRSEIHKLLSDPFYCGEFIFNNKLYKKAKHQPLVSKELFYFTQGILQRKTKAGKYNKHFFMFGGGLIVCGECGRVVTAEIQKGYRYYHCTHHENNCSQRSYIREERIEEQILDILDSFVIKNSKLLKWVRKALKESHQNEEIYHSSIMHNIEKRRKKIEKRISVLYDERIDKMISKEFYNKKQAQYEEELESLINTIENHTKANIDYKKLGINIFELSQKGKEIYKNKAFANEKKELLNFIFLNFKLKDKKVYPSFKNGFEVIAKRAEDGNWLRDLDSNQD